MPVYKCPKGHRIVEIEVNLKPPKQVYCHICKQYYEVREDKKGPKKDTYEG